MLNRGLGWRPEIPDARDRGYALPHLASRAPLPLNVDLRRSPAMPPVQDQGQTNSCTGHAAQALLDYLHPDPAYASGVFMPSSRRFLYYGAREIERQAYGWAIADEGAYIRDVMKTMAAGVPHELACRWDPAKINQKPKPVAYTQASRRRRIATYHPLETVAEMQACLAEGFPFVFGFTVYDSFMSDAVAESGDLGMPNLTRETPQGGHAVLAVGYDLTTNRFIVRNSWGEDWGGPMRGYFTMPFAYLADRNLSDDIWTARL